MKDWIQNMRDILEANFNQYKWYFVAAGAVLVVLAVLLLKGC